MERVQSKKRRVQHFRDVHEIDYGLKVASRDPSTSKVTSVVCRFCIAFGREAKVGQKRKVAATKKFFRAPFRPSSYSQHHELQHPHQWSLYMDAAADTKATFFAGRTPVSNRVTSHFEGSEGRVYFMVDPEIIDVLISDVFFDPDDGAESVIRATAIFEKLEPGQDGQSNYRVSITQVKMFRLIISFVSLGASFRLVSRQVSAAREELKLGYLASCSEAKVSSFVRVALAANMQVLKRLLTNCWAFSVAFDSATIANISLFDIRVRFAVSGHLYCFHLIAMPLTCRHRGQNMFDAFAKVVDVVVPQWRDTLLCVSSDGARNMTGDDRGVVSIIGRGMSPGRVLFRTWCGAHQLDLVFQIVVSRLCDEEFYSTLTSLIGYLRRQFNFISELGSKCPTVSTTRWKSLGNVLKWLALHRAKVMNFIDNKNPTNKPSKSWWIAALSMHGLTSDVDVLFKSLQAQALLIPRQLALFDRFISRLKELGGIIGPLTDAQTSTSALDGSPQIMGRTQAGRVFCTSRDDIVTFVKGRGSFATAEYEKLDTESATSLIDAFGKLFVELASGVSDIQPQRDADNVAVQDQPMPCLPFSFCNMREDEFVALVVQMRSRLESKFTTTDIDALEGEHREFRAAVHREPVLKSIVDGQSDRMLFEDGWGGGLYERFPLLCEFAGGLASMYLGISRVEADFSVLGIEKNALRTSLTSLSLDGIMHAKQFMELQALAPA